MPHTTQIPLIDSSLAPSLAFEHISPTANNPTIVWLCGYRSNMSGTKVQFLKSWAVEQGFGFFCFDYSGHGQSVGKLEDGTISQWRAQSQAIISQHVTGKMILVGSSMGGWIALRLAELLPAHTIEKLVLIAPAPDFTHNLIWDKLTPKEQADFKTSGIFTRPSRYSPQDDVFRYSFIEDAKTELIFNRLYTPPCPVHILHGTADLDVPIAHGHKLMHHLGSANVTFTQIQGGDHRLSCDEDLQVLVRAILYHCNL